MNYKNILSALMNKKGCKELFDIYLNNNFEIRFVGGCVRDALLGKSFSDIDLVTNAKPEESISLLSSYNLKIIPTGIKHGTITVIINDSIFEITTIRKDIKCDGRFAVVEFGNDFEDDAKRRDLTINSLSVDYAGKIYDYFGGSEDLTKGLIRFVGDPELRVKEDFLRILRFYRFYSYYGKILDHDSRVACQRNFNKVKTLSGERIRDEFGKILISPFLAKVLKIMSEDKVLQELINSEFLDFEWLNNLENFCNFHNIEPIALRNLVAIINNKSANCDYWILSKKEKNYLKIFNKISDDYNFDKKNYLKDLYYLGKDLFIEKIILQASFCNYKMSKKEFEIIKNLETPTFPIIGQDLLNLGFKQGVELGVKIKQLEQKWIESNFILSKEELIEEI